MYRQCLITCPPIIGIPIIGESDYQRVFSDPADNRTIFVLYNIMYIAMSAGCAQC